MLNINDQSEVLYHFTCKPQQDLISIIEIRIKIIIKIKEIFQT